MAREHEAKAKNRKRGELGFEAKHAKFGAQQAQGENHSFGFANRHTT